MKRFSCNSCYDDGYINDLNDNTCFLSAIALIKISMIYMIY